MNNFWHNLPRPFFVLAPMEAVTDVVFRHVVRRAGAPDVYFTEFTNATGWAHAGDKAIGGRLLKTDDEHPIVAQLWGSDPSAMAKLSVQCREWGYDGIDINMGCPDKAAIKGGGGAHMIRTPDVAYAMIAAAKESGLPVSVKTRLGYTYVDEWREWLTGLLQQDIAALTVHLRTKKEMSKVPAHFELIDDIKTLRDTVAPQTLLIINGDIADRAHGEALVAKHGVDGVMIGRGVFADPFCFINSAPVVTDSQSESARRSLDAGEKRQASLRKEMSPRSYASLADSRGRGTWPVARTPETEEGRKPDEKIDLLRYHLDEYDTYVDQLHRPFETLKRFFKIYVNNFDGAAEVRDKLMHCNNTAEVRGILDEHFGKSI